MIQIIGELRKIDVDQYTNKKTGEVGKQHVLIVEPKIGRKNYEVFMSSQQSEVGIHDWNKLLGKQVKVPITIFFSKQYGFMKFNLLGAGKPLSE